MSTSNSLFNSAKKPEILVGKVLRPWGIKGVIKILSLSDNDTRFCVGNSIYIEEKKYIINDMKKSKNNILISLDTIKNANQAELLKGKSIKVFLEDISSLESGNYYHFQLLGLKVFTEERKYLGDLRDILNTGANDIYIISLGNSKDILLPAIKDVVLEIDLNKEHMIVKIPKGLL